MVSIVVNIVDYMVVNIGDNIVVNNNIVDSMVVNIADNIEVKFKLSVYFEVEVLPLSVKRLEQFYSRLLNFYNQANVGGRVVKPLLCPLDWPARLVL